jgi:hypothetical protein
MLNRVVPCADAYAPPGHYEDDAFLLRVPHADPGEESTTCNSLLHYLTISLLKEEAA